MYGVITCPRCRTVQGADLSHSRISCVRCHHKIDVVRAVVHFSTDSPQELADAVRRFSDQKRGQEIPFPAPRGATVIKGSVESIVTDLGRRKGAFGLRDLATRLEVDGEELEKLVARLLASGLMYETGPGTYRLV